MPRQTRRVPLPSNSIGAQRAVLFHDYGAPDARPKAYLQAAIHAGEIGFEEVARAHSELPSAGKGGTTAWLTAQQVGALGPVVSRAFRQLAEGATSGLVQQSEGLRGDTSLWILRRLGNRPARDRTLEEARARVENDMGNERVRAIQAGIEAELRDALELRRVAASAAGTTSGATAAEPPTPENHRLDDSASPAFLTTNLFRRRI